jgi:hypothetical protein
MVARRVLISVSKSTATTGQPTRTDPDHPESGRGRGALLLGRSLALAVVKWVEETWDAEVGRLGAEEADPVDALIAVARGHAIYCRRDVARVMMTLRVEFAGQDHPVGRAITEITDRLDADCAELVAAGRRSGAIPPGPPPRETAAAILGVVEAVGVQLAWQAPYDAGLAERAVRGVLGLPLTPVSTGPRSIAASRPPAHTETEIHE